MGGQYFWDPLTAAAVTKRSLLTVVGKKLRVDGSGNVVESPKGNPVEVAVHAQRPAFERELLNALLGGARFAAPRTAGPVALTFDRDRCTYAGPREAEAGEVSFDPPGTKAITCTSAGHTAKVATVTLTGAR